MEARNRWLTLLCLAVGVTAVGSSGTVFAQSENRGAGVLATTILGVLPGTPLFWHLHTFPDLAQAEAARDERSAVTQTFGKVWLFTIAEAGWRPTGASVDVASIGPLPLPLAGGRYVASYLSAATPPGFQTDVHQHGGPEALFTLDGEVCVETPDGKLVGRAGEPLLIAGGRPMQLTSIGTSIRRSIVLVLHDPGQEWKLAASGWLPKRLCGG